MENWTPAAEGAGFEFTPILKSLEPFRERLLVLTGLNSIPPPWSTDTHPRASTRFLTDVPPRETRGLADLRAGTSIDQIIAREISQSTRLKSLELALESSESAGACSSGFSCAYTSTISWSSPTTPLPMEHNPRAVFRAPLRRRRQHRSDRAAGSSRENAESASTRSAAKLGQLRRGLGSGDRAKLDEYFEAIRDVERRIQMTEARNARELPVMEGPAGVPDDFEEHARLMYRPSCAWPTKSI